MTFVNDDIVFLTNAKGMDIKCAYHKITIWNNTDVN